MSSAQRPLGTAAAIALVTAIGLLAIAGCGSDSESTTTPQSSETTQESSTQSTVESTTTESTTTEDNGGATSPSGADDNTSSDGDDGSGGSAVPDSPSNDVTPPANTPQGKFEQYCNQNPGACG